MPTSELRCRFLYLVDRAKDMILRGGENIYCAEVEGALFTHPAVLETVAFAVPDDRLGEEVGVAVHLKPDALLDAPGLREHMSSRLAAFKVPLTRTLTLTHSHSHPHPQSHS